MEIKIVGSIPDKKTLNEITSIAKVFVYENRIKNFNYAKNRYSAKLKKPDKLYKNNLISHKIITKPLSHIMVKGLM